MELMLAFLTGFLFFAGFYQVLQMSLVRVLLGILFLGHATNLLIFSAPGVVKGAPAFIADADTQLFAPYADPIPQALILTAIVIGFGVFAFFIVLASRAHQTTGEDHLEGLKELD